MKYITKKAKNDKFSTTLINFIFQFKCTNDEIMAFTMLPNMLSFTNKKYNEDDTFAKEKLKRYIMSFGARSQSINNEYFINFSLLIPNTNLIDDDFLESAINFALDSIYEPNIEDDLFKEKYFEREKRSYIEYLLNGYKNINFIAEKNILEILDKNGIFNKSKYSDLENIKHLENKDLVDFYNKYIKNIKPKIFINGNIDFDKVESYLENYMKPLHLKDYKLDFDYDFYFKDRDFIEKNDKSNYYQSILYMVYNVSDYKETDMYILYLLNLLLSSSASDLLIKKLRKKYNLVYTCGSSILIRNGLIIIKANCSLKNIEMAKLVIKDLMLSFKNMDSYKEEVSNIIYKLHLNLERSKDDFFELSSNLINNYFKSDKTREEELNIISNLEKSDIENLANRLNLNCIYTLEGNNE